MPTSIVRRPLLAFVAPVILAVPTSGIAQTIGGRVLDLKTRRPAQLVDIRVLGDSGAVLAKTTTDTMGVFYAMLDAPTHVRLEFAIADVVSFRTDTMSVRADEFVQRDFLIEIPRVFSEIEVEKQVTQRPGPVYPVYPKQLKELGIEGEVLASFVVDTTGRAIMRTFRVHRATHLGFIEAVEAAVARMSFNPAEVGGHKVKQMVQLPFTFTIER